MKKIYFTFSIVFFFFFYNQVVSQTVLISHRGGASLAPENTLLAIEKSIDIEVEYVEIDIRVSVDDSIMVLHDETVDRTTNGTGSISTMTFEELRLLDAGSWFDGTITDQLIPTFEETLILSAPSNTGLVIELKAISGTTIDRIINLVYQYEMEERVIIASSSFDFISTVKDIDPAIKTMFFADFNNFNIELIKTIGGEWLGTSIEVSIEDIEYAHSKDVLLSRWTINHPIEMAQLIDIGIDGIITDIPQVLITLLDESPPSDVIMNSVSIDAPNSVLLSWEPATEDPNGKVVAYKIYRNTYTLPDELLITTENTTSYNDESAQDLTTHFYRIKAVNAAGLSSENYSNEVSITTPIDNVPPEIEYIDSKSNSEKIIIKFSEILDKAKAENPDNYNISNSKEVKEAILSYDQKSVILYTEDLAENEYYISLNNISDIATSPNNVPNNQDFYFTNVPLDNGIMLHYGFDKIENERIYDDAFFSFNGKLNNSMILRDGVLGNSLYFDGVDDYVELEEMPIIEDEVSISAWIKLALVPIDLQQNYGPILDSEEDIYILYEDRGFQELRFKVRTENGAQRPGIKSEDLVAEEWIHVVGVYNGAAAKIYLNGKLKDTHPLTGKLLTGQKSKLGESSGSFFKGMMDIVQVFDYALTTKEIDSMYQNQHDPLVVAAIETTFGSDAKTPYIRPNPLNNHAEINYSILKSGLVQIDILDFQGTKIMNIINKYHQKGVHQITFDASQLIPGIYLCKIQMEEKEYIQKLIIQR